MATRPLNAAPASCQVRADGGGGGGSGDAAVQSLGVARAKRPHATLPPRRSVNVFGVLFVLGELDGPLVDLPLGVADRKDGED